MKKIISLFIACVLVVAAFSFTASAEEAKISYAVDWSSMSYKGYWYDELKTDSQYKLTATKSSLSTSPLKGTDTERRAFVANKTFAITSNTKYEYVFQAKNDTNYKYGGVVFAFGGGIAYFVYGSFNNVADAPNDGNCDIRVQKGLDYQEGKSCNTGFTRSYIKAALDSDGYGTFKIVLNGYTASVYVLTDASAGTYTMVGNSITLPSDAKIAFGAYYRGVDTNGPRTLVVRNAVLTAVNEAAAEKIVPGAYDFIDYVSRVEKDYLEADYTKETFTAFADALKAAKELIKNGDFDATKISSAKSAIDSAVILLELKDTDFTALKALADEAALINEADCDPDAFAAMKTSLEKAQALLEAGATTQSEVDAMLAELEAKLDALGLDEDKFTDEEKDTGAESDIGSDIGSDSGSDSGSGSGFESDSAQVSLSTGYSTDSVGSDTTANAKAGGCGSSIAVSSLLAALTVGAVLVFKKKED